MAPRTGPFATGDRGGFPSGGVSARKLEFWGCGLKAHLTQLAFQAFLQGALAVERDRRRHLLRYRDFPFFLIIEVASLAVAACDPPREGQKGPGRRSPTIRCIFPRPPPPKKSREARGTLKTANSPAAATETSGGVRAGFRRSAALSRFCNRCCRRPTCSFPVVTMMAEFAQPPSPARWLLFLTVAVGGMRTELSFAAAEDAAPPGKIGRRCSFTAAGSSRLPGWH